MKSVHKPLAKRDLILLGLTAATAAAAATTDAAIHKKIFESVCPSDLALCNTTLIISNEEMNDIMKTMKNLVLLLAK